MIHDPNLSCMIQSWTISMRRVLAMKHHVDPHLPLLVGMTTPEENGVDDLTLHIHTIATAAAPTPTRTLIGPNVDERTVQP